jgi:hypothetical protein
MPQLEQEIVQSGHEGDQREPGSPHPSSAQIREILTELKEGSNPSPPPIASPDAAADVRGTTTENGIGVLGQAVKSVDGFGNPGALGAGIGVKGESESGQGVVGTSVTDAGVYGSGNPGVLGEASGDRSVGVRAVARGQAGIGIEASATGSGPLSGGIPLRVVPAAPGVTPPANAAPGSFFVDALGKLYFMAGTLGWKEVCLL